GLGNRTEVEVFYAIIKDYFTEKIVEENEISWTMVEETWDDINNEPNIMDINGEYQIDSPKWTDDELEFDSDYETHDRLGNGTEKDECNLVKLEGRETPLVHRQQDKSNNLSKDKLKTF
ncbi:25385_t:CDS:2, partial [Racocetra persica]